MAVKTVDRVQMALVLKLLAIHRALEVGGGVQNGHVVATARSSIGAEIHRVERGRARAVDRNRAAFAIHGSVVSERTILGERDSGRAVHIDGATVGNCRRV